mmetsp:Transcript_10436/g.38811  ORF Transcript_10436/g.38811 Transcript_10436/m.38811 type:complete len:119 (-) Transcript_10436:1485-1841(-)
MANAPTWTRASAHLDGRVKNVQCFIAILKIHALGMGNVSLPSHVSVIQTGMGRNVTSGCVLAWHNQTQTSVQGMELVLMLSRAFVTHTGVEHHVRFTLASILHQTKPGCVPLMGNVFH